jgi:hypothetical protein
VEGKAEKEEEDDEEVVEGKEEEKEEESVLLSCLSKGRTKSGPVTQARRKLSFCSTRLSHAWIKKEN